MDVMPGSPAEEAGRYRDEDPWHEVELTRPYYFGVVPVTQDQYARVTGVRPSHFSPTGDGREALTEARTVEVGKQKTRVFSAEHAVAVALQTNRATDRLKIEHLLESGREPLDEARLAAILKAHGLEDRWKKFLETRR